MTNKCALAGIMFSITYKKRGCIIVIHPLIYLNIKELISEQRIFSHSLINSLTYTCNNLFILRSVEHLFDELGDKNHKILFCTTSCQCRSSKTDTACLE